MTRPETAKVLAAIVEVYPAFLNRRNLDNTVNIWQLLFADDPYKVVEAGVLAFMSTDTKGFPPSPGQIKEQISMLIRSTDPDEGQAWALVSKALKNSVYSYRQEYDKLPESVQMAIGAPEMLREWALQDEDTVQTVVASNFQRGYRARVSHRREMAKLPSSVRETIGNMLPAGSGWLMNRQSNEEVTICSNS